MRKLLPQPVKLTGKNIDRLRVKVERLNMKVWIDDGHVTGCVFCKKCGWGGDITISLSRWLLTPVSCGRFGCGAR